MQSPFPQRKGIKLHIFLEEKGTKSDKWKGELPKGPKLLSPPRKNGVTFSSRRNGIAKD
jgi:hypothetical protein